MIRSTGKMYNHGCGLSQSGFFVTDSIFVSALRFHPWAVPHAPTEDEIELFKRDEEKTELFVSTDMYNEDGQGDDNGASKAVLVAWYREAEIGVFRCSGRRGHHVGIDALAELPELMASSAPFQLCHLDRVMGCGYNECPGEDEGNGPQVRRCTVNRKCTPQHV